MSSTETNSQKQKRSQKKRSLLPQISQDVDTLIEDTGITSVYDMRRHEVSTYVPVANTRKDDIDKHKYRSLFCFKPNNAFRRACLMQLYNKWFHHIMFVVVLTNFFLMASATTYEMDYMARDRNWQLYIEIGFNIVFTQELLLRIVAYGLIDSGPHSFLRTSAMSYVDLFSVTVGWVSITTAMDGFWVVRSLRLIRIVKIASFVRGIRTQLITLFVAIPGMVPAFLFCLLLILFFGVFFQQFAIHKFNYRCIEVGEDITSEIINSGEQCNPDPYWGKQCRGDDVTAKVCVNVGSAPMSGIISFNNQLVSMLNVLVCFSMEGWTEIMYMYGDLNGHLTYLGFFAMVISGAYIATKLISAVLANQYEVNRGIEDKKKLISDRRKNIQQLTGRLATTQAEFDGKQDKILEEGTLKSSPRHALYVNDKCAECCLYGGLGRCGRRAGLGDQEDNSDKLGCFSRGSICIRHPARLFTRVMVKHSIIWTLVTTIVVLYNVAVLSVDHYGVKGTLRDWIDGSTIFCVVFFLFDMCIKIFGLGPKEFMNNGFNIMEGVISVAALFEYIFNGTNAFSSLHLLRMLRLLDLTGTDVAVQSFIRTIILAAYDSFMSACILVAFVFIGAVIGRAVLMDSMFEDDGSTARNNFNGFYWSSITVFQIISPENWNSVLLLAKQGQGWNGAITIICIFVVGYFFVLSLFLSVMLSSFNTVDDKIDEEKRNQLTDGNIERRKMLLEARDRLEMEEMGITEKYQPYYMYPSLLEDDTMMKQNLQRKLLGLDNGGLEPLEIEESSTNTAPLPPPPKLGQFDLDHVPKFDKLPSTSAFTSSALPDAFLNESVNQEASAYFHKKHSTGGMGLQIKADSSDGSVKVSKLWNKYVKHRKEYDKDIHDLLQDESCTSLMVDNDRLYGDMNMYDSYEYRPTKDDVAFHHRAWHHYPLMQASLWERLRFLCCSKHIHKQMEKLADDDQLYSLAVERVRMIPHEQKRRDVNTLLVREMERLLQIKIEMNKNILSALKDEELQLAMLEEQHKLGGDGGTLESETHLAANAPELVYMREIELKRKKQQVIAKRLHIENGDDAIRKILIMPQKYFNPFIVSKYLFSLEHRTQITMRSQQQERDRYMNDLELFYSLVSKHYSTIMTSVGMSPEPKKPVSPKSPMSHLKKKESLDVITEEEEEVPNNMTNEDGTTTETIDVVIKTRDITVDVNVPHTTDIEEEENIKAESEWTSWLNSYVNVDMHQLFPGIGVFNTPGNAAELDVAIEVAIQDKSDVDPSPEASPATTPRGESINSTASSGMDLVVRLVHHIRDEGKVHEEKFKERKDITESKIKGYHKTIFSDAAFFKSHPNIQKHTDEIMGYTTPEELVVVNEEDEEDDRFDTVSPLLLAQTQGSAMYNDRASVNATGKSINRGSASIYSSDNNHASSISVNTNVVSHYEAAATKMEEYVARKREQKSKLTAEQREHYIAVWQDHSVSGIWPPPIVEFDEDDERKYMSSAPVCACLDMHCCNCYMRLRYRNYLLGCVSEQCSLRRLAIKLVEHPFFEVFVLLVTFYSCIIMTIDDPHVPANSDKEHVIFISNWIIMVLFLVELALKLFAYGVIISKNAYFRNPWNVFDGIAIVLSSISFLMESGQYKNVFRALRSLRAFRFLSHFQATKDAIGVVWAAVKSCGLVAFFGMLLFIMYGLIGVAFFKGKLHRCYMHEYPDDQRVEMGLDEEECRQLGYFWENPINLGNFDHLGSALLVLYEFANMEGWPDYMFLLADINGSGKAPLRDNEPYNALYVVFGIVLFGFFYLNLFIGTIIDTYDSTVSSDLNEVQDSWLRVYKLILDNQPPQLSLQPRPSDRVIENETYRYRYEAMVNVKRDVQRKNILPDTSAIREMVGKQIQRKQIIPIHIAAHEEVQQLAGEGVQDEEGNADANPVLTEQVQDKLTKAKYGLQNDRQKDDLEDEVFESIFWSIDDTNSVLASRENTCYSLRRFLYYFTSWTYFEDIMLLVVILNLFALGQHYDGETADYADTLNTIHKVCCYIFIVEAFLKMLGLSFQQYIRSFWRVIELFVACVALIGLITVEYGHFNWLEARVSPALFGALTLLRFIRIFTRFNVLSNLVNTIFFSLTALYNLGFVLIVVFFVYAVVGMNLFSTVESGEVLDDYNNFKNFLYALVVLCRILTGENWNVMMREVGIRPPFCDGEACGNVGQAYAYFLSFEMICALLLLNMVVAVIFKQFDYEMENRENKDIKIPILRRIMIACFTTCNRCRDCLHTRVKSCAPEREDEMMEEKEYISYMIYKNRLVDRMQISKNRIRKENQLRASMPEKQRNEDVLFKENNLQTKLFNILPSIGNYMMNTMKHVTNTFTEEIEDTSEIDAYDEELDVYGNATGRNTNLGSMFFSAMKNVVTGTIDVVKTGIAGGHHAQGPTPVKIVETEYDHAPMPAVNAANSANSNHSNDSTTGLVGTWFGGIGNWFSVPTASVPFNMTPTQSLPPILEDNSVPYNTQATVPPVVVPTKPLVPRGNRIDPSWRLQDINESDIINSHEDMHVSVSFLYEEKYLQEQEVVRSEFKASNLPISTKDIRRFNRIWSRLAKARCQYYDSSNPSLNTLHVAQLPALLSRLQPPLRPVLSREGLLVLIENARRDRLHQDKHVKEHYEALILKCINEMEACKLVIDSLDKGVSRSMMSDALVSYDKALNRLSMAQDEYHDFQCYMALQISMINESNVKHNRILMGTIDELRIPTDGLYVHYVDVLYRLCLSAMSRLDYGSMSKSYLVQKAIKDEFIKIIRTTIWNDDVKNVSKNMISEATIFKHQTPANSISLNEPSGVPASPTERNSVISGPKQSKSAIPGSMDNRLHQIKARQSISVGPNRGSISPGVNSTTNTSQKQQGMPALSAQDTILFKQKSIGAYSGGKSNSNPNTNNANNAALCLTPLAAIMTSVDKFANVVPASLELHGSKIYPKLYTNADSIKLAEAHSLSHNEALERIIDQIPQDDERLECLRAEARKKFPELFEKEYVINAGLLLRIVKVQRIWRLQSAKRVHVRNVANRIMQERLQKVFEGKQMPQEE